MSPEGRALAKLESLPSWQSWCDPAKIERSSDKQQYMKDRLRAAFLLGFKEGVGVAADRVRDLVLGKIE